MSGFNRRRILGLCFLFDLLCLVLPPPVFSGAFIYDLDTNSEKVQRKWSSPKIKWRINPTGAPVGAKDIIQQAFQIWEQNSTAQISDEYMGETTISSPQADGYSDFFFNVSLSKLAGGRTVIALTLLNSSSSSSLSAGSSGEITEADILIDPTIAAQAVTTPSSDPTQYDLLQMLTHEIGHAFGLAHSFLIDSIMYPAIPSVTNPADYIALYRAPKRSLAQDDAAWISALYPASDFESNTAQIGGRISAGGTPFIGAQIIAVKTDESDAALQMTALGGQSGLVAKGLQNVSAFSEGEGKFSLKGLKAGTYKLFAQSSSNFLNLSLANVNAYLSQFGSSGTFPLAFWKNPDCASGVVTTSANLTETFNAASALTLKTDQAYCNVEILAHTADETCGSEAELMSRCSDGDDGGCSLNPRVPFSGSLIWVTIAFIFAIIAIRKTPSPV